MKTKILNKFKSTLPQKGEIFTKKSMTIIGQEVTPEEILRRHVQGFPIPQKVYTEVGIQQFRDLSALDQIDYLRDIADTNRASRQSINLAQSKLQKQQALQAQKTNEQKIREEAIAEFKSKQT